MHFVYIYVKIHTVKDLKAGGIGVHIPTSTSASQAGGVRVLGPVVSSSHGRVAQRLATS
jgi:hypothetical protein